MDVMTLMARLCALCAICALGEMALPQGSARGYRMVGGMLMLHLVISGAARVLSEISGAQGLNGVFQALIR